MSSDERPEQKSSADALPGAARPDEVPVQVDLLRADLYQIIDKLARSEPLDRRDLLVEFEQSWALFKAALDPATPHLDQ